MLVVEVHVLFIHVLFNLHQNFHFSPLIALPLDYLPCLALLPLPNPRSQQMADDYMYESMLYCPTLSFSAMMLEKFLPSA